MWRRVEREKGVESDFLSSCVQLEPRSLPSPVPRSVQQRAAKKKNGGGARRPPHFLARRRSKSCQVWCSLVQHRRLMQATLEQRLVSAVEREKEKRGVKKNPALSLLSLPSLRRVPNVSKKRKRLPRVQIPVPENNSFFESVERQ